ncbi:MAG: ABC transporter ATP-binding protein [Phycisphaerales bacterium JB037]
MSTSIQIRGLVKTFPSNRGPVTAVNQIDLDIAPGELFFLLGPSGCGKTTLLRMIAGFIDPTAGSITFNGRDITHTPPNKRNTGMVFQSYALWPHMSVADNVAFGLSVRKVPADEKRKRVQEALDAVHLGDLGKRKPNELSGGQQQRVALARALVIRPEVLLLDEPLSNLDAKLRIELRAQIRRVVKESGLTSIYVTHDQKEALSMADRIAIIREGQVEQLGTPAELYRKPRSRFVAEFLGETNFIEAKITGTRDSATPNGSATRELLLDCPAGHLRAEMPDHLPRTDPGTKVLCSIRPEALRLAHADEPDTLRARRLSTTYLGEMAQHILELPGSVEVKVAELNPFGGGNHIATSGAPEHSTLDIPADPATTPEVAVTVSPRDVVVLPAS